MFDGGHILDNQSDVEPEEHGNHDQHTEVHQIADDCEIVRVEGNFESAIKDKDNILNPCWQVVDEDFCHRCDCVKQQEQEEFSIVESDTIIQPWTVVVHVEYTSVAS